jgi:hypothetical protein
MPRAEGAVVIVALLVDHVMLLVAIVALLLAPAITKLFDALPTPIITNVSLATTVSEAAGNVMAVPDNEEPDNGMAVPDK